MKKRILSVFMAMTMLLTVIPTVTITAGAVRSGDWEYEVINDTETIRITKFYGSGENVSIPAEINGFNVTAIGTTAFLNNAIIKTVIIPNGVTSIEYDSFSIYEGAFYNCTSLSSVTIPDTITWIGSHAFSRCSSLISISLPRVINIGPYAFSGCTSLETVKLSDNLTSISYHAFSSCTSLNEITIPRNVNEIVSSAFDGCTSLKTVIFKSVVPPTSDKGDILWGYGNSFRNCPVKTVYIPTGSLATYTTADVIGKTGYEIIEQGGPITVAMGEGGSTSGGGVYCEGESVELTASPNPGFRFDCWFAGGQVVSANKTYTFIMTADMEKNGYTAEARFIPLGRILGKTPITIFDALEILKYLVNMECVIKPGNDAFKSACITGESSPTIFDALEILKYLVGMPSMVEN